MICLKNQLLKNYLKLVRNYEQILDYGFDDIKLDIELPKPIIVEHDGFKVVRDDLLDGGTKRRKNSTTMFNG